MSPKMTRTTTADRIRMRTWKAYGETLKRLQWNLPEDTQGRVLDDIAPRVIEACSGMGYGAWQEMDERSGWRDLASRWHWVRSTRNSPAWGPQLMAAINKRVPGRTYAG